MCRDQSLRDLEELADKRLIIHVKGQVVRHIDAQVRFRGVAEEVVLKLHLVHVHGHVVSAKVLESTRMVEVQVAHNDGLMSLMSWPVRVTAAGSSCSSW